MNTYEDFLKTKRVAAVSVGIDIPAHRLSAMLFDFQKEIVVWALRKGRAAIFADCGLGKSPMCLEWARIVCEHTRGDVLILTPLAVAQQMKREGRKFGIETTVCRSQSDVRPGINITNYEMLEHFDASHFRGVVLDESSILKSFMGKIKRTILELFHDTAFKLALTATPAPNDHLELGNHAEFLNVMPSNEMIMRWFLNDTMEAGGYRLKGHAVKDFWRWVSSWAISLSRPSDIGYSDEGFNLPDLRMITHEVEALHESDDALFVNASLSATTMHREMRKTAETRARKVAELVQETDSPWVIWCNTNYEADALTAILPDLVEVRGSDSLEVKEARLLGFSDGKISKLLSKSSICGFGMNWQHCSHMAFMGLSYSYEQFYQAVRRSWRFGQTQEVTAHIIYAETEGDVLRSLTRKRKDHESMKAEMNAAMRDAMRSDGGGVKIRSYDAATPILVPRWMAGASR
jgi:superfamily II DNA or RNA helicase